MPWRSERSRAHGGLSLHGAQAGYAEEACRKQSPKALRSAFLSGDARHRRLQAPAANFATLIGYRFVLRRTFIVTADRQTPAPGIRAARDMFHDRASLPDGGDDGR